MLMNRYVSYLELICMINNTKWLDKIVVYLRFQYSCPWSGHFYASYGFIHREEAEDDETAAAAAAAAAAAKAAARTDVPRYSLDWSVTAARIWLPHRRAVHSGASRCGAVCSARA